MKTKIPENTGIGQAEKENGNYTNRIRLFRENFEKQSFAGNPSMPKMVVGLVTYSRREKFRARKMFRAIRENHTLRGPKKIFL